PDQIARDWPDLDTSDPDEPAAETLIARARAAEEAALAVPGVTNSEGAEASWSRAIVALAASNGFAGAYRDSGHGVSAAVLAGSGTGMERDYDYSSAVYAADLQDPAAIGKSADDPHRRRGLHSKPFDGEGIANRRRAIIEKGVLTTWLLDLRSARQLGLKTTGHASRGTSSPPSPSPTNLWLEPGAVTRDALIGD